jgi:hypothetical protein
MPSIPDSEARSNYSTISCYPIIFYVKRVAFSIIIIKERKYRLLVNEVMKKISK